MKTVHWRDTQELQHVQLERCEDTDRTQLLFEGWDGNSDKRFIPRVDRIHKLSHNRNATRLGIRSWLPFPFLRQTHEDNWLMANRLLRYINSTKDLGLKVSGKERIHSCFSDADYGSCSLSRRNCTGQMILAQGTPVFYASSRQPCVSLSSTGSELIAGTVNWLVTINITNA